MSHTAYPGPSNDFLTVIQGLSDQLHTQIDLLRTMHVEPGRIEPVDYTGMDLCGRIRILSNLCSRLEEEITKQGRP